MFNHHFSQSLILNYGESPNIFSGFENKIGSYSSAIRLSKGKTKEYKRFKNRIKDTIIIKNEENEYDILENNKIIHNTEKYGYEQFVSKYSEETAIEYEDKEWMVDFPSFDSNRNFAFGINLRSVFASYDGITFEDGIVISESAASKLSHTTVEKTVVVLNENDFLVPFYKGKKLFPDIGEKVGNGGSLCIVRRIHKENIKSSLTSSSRNDNKIIVSDGSYLRGIEIFSNNDESMKNNSQLWEYYKEQNNYFKFLIDLEKEFKHNKVPLEKVSYILQYEIYRAKQMLDKLSNFEINNNTYNGFVIIFYTAKESPAIIGSKLANRFGNKGVISSIIPDEKMPIKDSEGKPVEVILNTSGVINRLNMSQIYEMTLSSMSKTVAKMIRNEASIDKKIEIYKEFINDISLCTGNSLQYGLFTSMSEEDKRILIDDIVSGNDIVLHIPPFVSGKVENIGALTKKYESVELADFLGNKHEMEIGKMFFMKLKQEASGKFSARSVGMTSNLGVPTKCKDIHHSTVPSKLGEQEMLNLMTGCPTDSSREKLHNFIASYSASEYEKINLLREQVGINSKDLSAEKKSKITSTVETILKCMGTSLEDEEANNKE